MSLRSYEFPCLLIIEQYYSDLFYPDEYDFGAELLEDDDESRKTPIEESERCSKFSFSVMIGD